MASTVPILVIVIGKILKGVTRERGRVNAIADLKETSVANPVRLHSTERSVRICATVCMVVTVIR